MYAKATLFAYAALLLWVPVSAALFAVLRPTLAFPCVLVGGILLLPNEVGFDLPGLPPFAKQEIASLAALLGCLLLMPRRLATARLGWGAGALLALLAVSPFATASLNPDALAYGPTHLPGLSVRDGISMAVRDLLLFGVPFFMACAVVRDSRGLRDLVLVLAVAGLLYSLLALFEVRFSPRLHKWAYGFHPHNFWQHVRWGGYRPMVFMSNGLAVSAFLALSFMLTISLARARIAVLGLPAALVAPYLGVVLVACKSLASLVYGMAAAPLLALTRPRVQVWVAALLAAFALLYPALRMGGLFPTEALTQLSALADEARAQSLRVRFENEDLLLGKATQRALFGWGGWQRERIFDEKWGRDLTITDSFWIIRFAIRGAVGLWVPLALLTLPIFTALRRLARVPGQADRLLLAGLAVGLAMAVVDLMPNGMFNPIPVLLAGAVLGAARGLSAAPAARPLEGRPAPEPERPEPRDVPRPAPRGRSPATLADLARGVGRRE